MGLHIPGLADAMEKLDDTAEQMAAINSNLANVVRLLEEQKALLAKQYSN